MPSDFSGRQSLEFVMIALTPLAFGGGAAIVWLRIVRMDRSPRNPKPETRNPKTETRNPKPETRSLKPETRNPNSEARCPKSQTRNPKSETQNPKPEARTPKDYTPKTTPGTYTRFPNSEIVIQVLKSAACRVSQTLDPKHSTRHPQFETLHPNPKFETRKSEPKFQNLAP